VYILVYVLPVSSIVCKLYAAVGWKFVIFDHFCSRPKVQSPKFSSEDSPLLRTCPLLCHVCSTVLLQNHSRCAKVERNCEWTKHKSAHMTRKNTKDTERTSQWKKHKLMWTKTEDVSFRDNGLLWNQPSVPVIFTAQEYLLGTSVLSPLLDVSIIVEAKVQLLAQCLVRE
jgi:hypothetical protein